MIQIGNRPIDTMYVGGKLVQQVYKGSKKVYPDSGVIPKAIRDSMVLWYDLKKQGATNESMQANPVLADHSGNGHDAVCGNFAWSGMSGIGGYNVNFNNCMSDWNLSNGLVEFYYNKIVVKNSGDNPERTVAYFSNKKIRPFTININGLTEGKSLTVKYRLVADGESTNVLSNVFNGTYQIPIDEENVYLFSFILKGYSENENLNVTIEQLPLYPNALVFDGVDDKATCPAFHLGKDWTLLFDIAWMDKVKASAGISKNPNFFVYNKGTEDGLTCYINRDSDGASVPNTIIAINSQLGFIDRDYSIIEDTGEQTNTSGSESIIMFGYNGVNFTTMALRKLLLFDRALSLDEIKWVKNNLMEETV